MVYSLMNQPSRLVSVVYNCQFLSFFIQTAWSKRESQNLHFVWYEDLKADFDGELAKIQSFLGTNVQGEKLEELKRRVDIKTMQAQATQQGGKTMGSLRHKFYQRNGQVGGLLKALKDDQEVAIWRKWIEDKIKETGIPMDIPES